jgi:DNA polymerase-3 subunit delta'
MNYQNIVGQLDVKSKLLKMVRSNKVPHAILFSGKDGCGHLPMALAFIQHLFCTNANDDGACNTCNACSRIQKLIHPDVHFVFPINKTDKIKSSVHLIKEFREFFIKHSYMLLEDWFESINPGNKQPIIAVDEANEILHKLSYTSYEGGYKVMLVWQPETMNTEAANKLLKILEEPPDKTVFILACSNPEQLLPTIFSRVQQINFHPCTDNEIANALIKEFEITPQLAAQTAMLANGNYGEAIHHLAEQNEEAPLLNEFQNFMRIALKFDATKATDWIDEQAKHGREKHKQFLHFGLEIFRDCLMYNFGNKTLIRVSGNEKNFLEKFAPFINQNNYEKLVEEFNQNYYYIERNANPKILFMDLILKTNQWLNVK